MNKKKLLIAGGVIFVLGAVALFAIMQPAGVKIAALTPAEEASLVEPGHAIAIAGDCAACHTRPGGEAFAGGRGLDTPFGRIYAPNVTSDKETGIGDWTLTDFARALHHGQDDDGENLYPAFSYPYYSKVTDNDVRALWAYFRTIPAVKYDAPKNELGFPFNIRLLLKGWNLLHFHGGRYKPDASKSEQWNRGAYLVQSLGHCGACHTPKNLIGGDRGARRLRGGVLEGWFASDLSNDKHTGIGNWTEADIVEFLSTGTNQYTGAYGSMTEVVQLSTSQMSAEDLAAIAAYLKSLPAPKGAAPKAAPAPAAAVMAKGKQVYEANCAECHQPDGAGAPGAYPVLAGNPNLAAQTASSTLQLVMTGGTDMPAFPQLSDADVAAVASYVRASFGNHAPAATDKDAKKIRDMLKARQAHAPAAAPAVQAPAETAPK